MISLDQIKATIPQDEYNFFAGLYNFIIIIVRVRSIKFPFPDTSAVSSSNSLCVSCKVRQQDQFSKASFNNFYEVLRLFQFFLSLSNQFNSFKYHTM